MARPDATSTLRRMLHGLLVAATLSTLTACADGARIGAAPQTPATPATEATTGFVASAHPLATEAGLEVLRRGGSAIDAAVAVQAMLGLVEPQSSGLMGGAILLHYDAASGRVDSYIGRERAPASAGPGMFTDADGHPLSRGDAMLSGHATGIPGALPVLAMAHAAHGKLEWSGLFDSAEQRAEQGFAVTPRMYQHIAGKFPQASAPDVKAMFAREDGTQLQLGDTFRNPAYAESLRTVAARGADALRTGPLADALIARLGQAPNGALVTAEDLQQQVAEHTDPICRPLRAYVVCVPPPPASGVGLLQLMMILDGTDIADRGPDDPRSWLLFAEASRIAYADRDHYVGDPRFADVPVDGLLAADYIAARRALIGAHAATRPPVHGEPAGAPWRNADATDEPGGTSHLVVVDAAGNAVSMTTTIESFFGSGRTVGGMFLNNQLTDFSWGPSAGAANAIAPGKRPRSSMSPVIVLDRDGRLVGAIGSPGGNAIPAYVAKTLVGWLYWKMPLQQAIALPNLVARGKNFNGEADAFAPGLREGLSKLGVDIIAGSGEDSGLHGVEWRDGRLSGAADPRREGVAAGL